MLAYLELTGRDEYEYRRQLLRFIPPLDRFYLKTHYDRQAAELEKAKRQGSKKSR